MTETPVEMASQSTVEGKNDLPSYESLLAKGKRNLMCKEIPEAVNQLQEAARLVAEKFGETANECAEVYLQYGIALLELARMENTVLGNALTGIPAESAEEEESSETCNVTENNFVEPDETTEEEKAKISDEIIEAMIESDDKDKNVVVEEDKGCSSVENKDVIDKENKAEDSGNVESSNADTDAPEKTDSEVVGEEAKEDNDVADEEEEEEEEVDGEEGVEENTEEAMEEDDKEDKNNTSQDEVTNLQLAWEMIELSKSIYKRGELTDAKLKQADCLLWLGEIGLETEQYAQAVADFQECLVELESLVEPSNRRLAEIHYQMALAHGYNNAFDDAISHFRSAIGIIELKIAELNKVIDPNNQVEGKEVAEEARETAKKELEELQNLIPDIKIKIDDAEEEKKSQCLKEVIRQSFKSGLNGDEETSNVFQLEGSTSAASSSAATAEKPVQDITHLVRKKRPQEDETQKSAEKKVKIDGVEVEGSECKLNGSVETTVENVNGSVTVLPIEMKSPSKQPSTDLSEESKVEMTDSAA